MTTTAQTTIPTLCAATPTVSVRDNRGLSVRSLQFNRTLADTPAQLLITQQRYTDSGQLHSQLDPRLFAA
ncbi:MAG TPA: hypothetical protein VNV36_15245, partial [Pseudomonas sp.]|uniref:hypothetical protein n=1 Tax=Pseudomonas sp. TaxID=306 RepID=UPI002BD6D8E2